VCYHGAKLARGGATMTSLSIDQLYEQQIKALPRAARLRLLARIADDLATMDDEVFSILDLEGVGAEIWHGIDVRAYLNTLRDEWDRP
jgi:hypothetical protein